MLFAEIVDATDRVAATRSRNRKTEILAECASRLEPGESLAGVALLAGKLRHKRTGVGWATIRAAFDTPGTEAAELTVTEVDDALAGFATIAGPGSVAARQRALSSLLARATPAEQGFLRSLFAGGIRQGALDGIVVEAVARAAHVSPQGLRRAWMFAGDLPTVAAAVLTGGAQALEQFDVELFRPVAPMLASPSADVDEAMKDTGDAFVEWKLDGARIQVHRDGDEVRVYSRRLNEVTKAVPEVVELARRLPGRRAILDGEVIALRSDASPLPFQVTMKRFGRKLDVASARAELPLSTFFFDCLLVDDQSMFERPLSERTQALDDLLEEPMRVPRIQTATAETASEFIGEAIARGHEGGMVKATGAMYEAGSRGASWLKVKPAHTLDLVVLAVEWGSGRRTGWLSNLHLGARDEAGGFVMLGKTFKGMTDAMLRWQTETFLGLEREREGHVVYVRPEIVVEIAFSDLQQSPHYPGGLALRFARVKRYRSDKRAEDADTITTVRALFETTAKPQQR